MDLKDIPVNTSGDFPFVSIVIPARNEETKIEEALNSVLSLDYPSYEVIVINDRSVDDTGKILDRMCAVNPELRVIHLTSLPMGWLGKNYALDTGAKQAKGEYILFTDADVVYKPETLLRAVPYVREKNIHHLCMAPSHIFRNFWLTSVVSIFEFFFMMKFKPWKARDPKSKFFIGIGSFNMITAKAYKATGGFETLRMRPDDDIMLGKLVKKFKFSSDFIYAPEFMQIEWYSSLREMIRAFYKNTYSGFNYNFFEFFFSIILLLAVCIFPYINLFLTDQIGLIFNIGIILIIFFIYLLLARANRISVFYFIMYPVACTVVAFLIIRAVTLTIIKGGVDWRGTFYSINELRKNKI
jgi:glycosyltransferase involved in cell wall biosynthesis